MRLIDADHLKKVFDCACTGKNDNIHNVRQAIYCYGTGLIDTEPTVKSNEQENREEYLNKCLKEIFDYCREHHPYCDGCIFYEQLQVGPLITARCKVIEAPEVFGEAKEKPPT